VAKGSEVLSQNQIDSLLSAIDSGSTTVQTIQEKGQTGDVRLYDFRHPSKFSREHSQTLHAVHEIFGRLLSTQLTTQMRLPVQMEVASVDQLTYDEFMRSITNPTVVLIYRLLPLEGTILFEFTPGTAISIIERLLGGPGRSGGRPRELTDIEQSLMSNVFNKGMSSFKEAWKHILPNLEPVIQALETNPRFVQICAPSDSVLVISFETKLGETMGSMRICLPYPTIEPVLPNMHREFFMNGQIRKEDTHPFLEEIKRNMDQVEVRLALLLGYTDITVRDLLGLQVGDVIQLNSQPSESLPVTVEQTCKFYARPGTLGRQMAAQITAIVDEG
jgi:flagellar motor switch protein FliM